MSTTNAELDEAVRRGLDNDIAELREGVEAWAAMSLPERAALLRNTHDSIHANAETWAAAAIRAKGTPQHWHGEEWLTGPYVAGANALELANSLESLVAGTSPLRGTRSRAVPGGRTALRVLPRDLKETSLFSGFSAEVWLKPGVDAAQAESAAGLGAREVGANGGVGLVLGAGNISAIGPLDVLYELVAHNRASVLKLNPTFGDLLPALEAALHPLIAAGLLRIVNGDANVGGYLAHHDELGHVHITGSGRTHDAIVWGTGNAAEERRAAGNPLLDKEITSELGGVSPIIVVPGEWSQADLRFQAEHVVTQRLQNSGHNCIAGQALVLSSEWPQREAFLREIRRVLDELPQRSAWYPGSDSKVDSARRAYPESTEHGGLLLVDVDESTSDELFTTEYFAPVLGHTSLPGTGAEFLRNAVEFANDRLDGTLGASLIVRPDDRSAMSGEFDSAIADLRYGTIGINVWSAFGFLMAALPWGAYPGQTVDDVGSGIGVVHNSLLIADTERAVITGPFRPFPRSVLSGEASLFPKPNWFVTSRSGNRTAEHLTRYGARPSWSRMPRVFAAAFRA